MSSAFQVSLSELGDALQWTSSGMGEDAAAYISKTTGGIVLIPFDDLSDDLPPADLDDPDQYWVVPAKQDLDLGTDLVRRYTRERLPEDLPAVHEYFRHRGAYAKFKHLLQQRDLLDDWYTFEQERTNGALLRWAEDNGISIAT